MGRSGSLLLGLLLAVLIAAALLLGRGRGFEPTAPDRPGERPLPAPELPVVPKEEAAPQLPPTWFRIEGIVLDAKTLTPIEDATVAVEIGQENSRTRTDRNGRWSLPVPRYPTAPSDCRVSAVGYLPESVNLLVSYRDLRIQPTAPPVFLKRPPVEIWGVVVDAGGAPVGDARLVGDTTGAGGARTDEQGRFGPIPGDHGTQFIDVFAPDGLTWCEAVEVPWDARGRIDIRIGLPRAFHMHGVVVDELGRPVPGVFIHDDYAEEVKLRVVTGPNGRFRAPTVYWESWLTAVKEGYVATNSTPARAGIEVEIELEPIASISGQVLREDGTPPPPGLMLGNVRARIRTRVAEDGTFRLAPFSTALSWVVVSSPTDHAVSPAPSWSRAFLSISPKLQPGENRTDVELRLPPLALLEGTVLDSITRRPIPGAMVEHCVTNAEGRYAIDVIEKYSSNADILLLVVAENYLPTRASHAENAPILLRPARWLDVIVVDESGHPLPGTIIRVTDAQINPKDISGVTDHQGRCRVQVPIGEEPRLQCSARDHDRKTVTAGATEESIRVIIPAAEAKYVLTVRDELGNPLPDAFIQGRERRLIADAAGRIPVTGDLDSPTLTAPGRELIRLPVIRMEDEPILHYVLREAPELRVRVVYADGRAAPQIGLDHEKGYSYTDQDGWARISGYARGEVIELTSFIAGWVNETWSVIAGEPPATLRLPGRGEIVIRYPAGLANGKQMEAQVFHNLDREMYIPVYESSSNGELRLDVSAGRFDLFCRVEPASYRYYKIEVRAGEQTIVDYDFPNPGRVRGRVLGQDGAPLVWADVRIFETRGDSEEADEQGRFELEFKNDEIGQAVGTFRLLVTGYGHAPFLTEPLDLTRDHDLDIRLPNGGTLTGRVIGGGPIASIEILTPGAVENSSCELSKNGRFHSENRIRAGRHQVRIETESGKTYFREVEIRDGIETAVKWQLP